MSIDGVVSAVSAMQQNRVLSKISYEIAGKQLDAVEQQGQAAVELLEAAVELQKDAVRGKLLDVRA